MLLVCRHCNRCPVNRPRGLCWGCFKAPAVRNLYPTNERYGRRGLGNHKRTPPLADRPTMAAPGTPEKLAVMEARVKAGLAVHHPRDARFAGDPRALESPRPVVAQAIAPPIVAEEGRRCPRLQHHRTGQAAIAFKIDGRRYWRYFGIWGSPEAAAKYAEFQAHWPAQLDETPNVKPIAPRLLTFNGEVKRLAEWARVQGLKPVTIAWRIGVLGWTVERALTTPTKPTRCAG